MFARASTAMAFAAAKRSFEVDARASAVSSTPCRSALASLLLSVSLVFRKTRGGVKILKDGSKPTAIWILAFAVAIACRIDGVFAPLIEGASGFATTTAAAAFVRGVTPT